MFKSIALILVVGCAFLTALCAAPVREDKDVRASMSNAYKRGIERIRRGEEENAKEAVEQRQPQKPSIFSHYTKGLKALGGGKPRLADQYRQHNYVPLAPSVLPAQHPYMPNNRLTPDAAAKIYRPQRPYQFTTDHLY